MTRLTRFFLYNLFVFGSVFIFSVMSIAQTATPQDVPKSQKEKSQENPEKKESKPSRKSKSKKSEEKEKEEAKSEREHKLEEEKIAPDDSWEQMLITSNIAISDWVDGVAEGLDMFLVGKKVTDRANETSVKITNSTFSREGEPITNSNSIGVNLRLPNVEEYWQLKFTSYDESEERRNVQNSYLRQTPRQQNYGASVGLFQKLGKVRTAFQPRVELGDPLKVSHSLSFESIADLETYQVNPRLEFYANADRGPGVFFAFNINFELTTKWSLTLINNSDYEDKKHLLTVSNGFSFGQSLDKISSLAYTFIVNSNNEFAYHMENYNASILYSRLLYKRILDFQISPYLDFPRSRDFHATPGATFNLNITF